MGRTNCSGFLFVARHMPLVFAAGSIKEQMMNIPDISMLFPHDMLTAAAILLGGGVIAMTLYTYIHDYSARYKRN